MFFVPNIFFSISYVPNTCVDPPHEKKIVAVQFQPEQTKESTLGPLAVTAGRDGKFKMWILAEERVIKGNKMLMCIHILP